MMHVVAALIEADGLLLLTRRLAGTHLAGLWEFPGGKVGVGETHEQALVRETQEELGAQVVVGPLVFEVAHEYPDRVIALHFYACQLLGAPRPLLGQEMRWVRRDELTSLDFPPADDELIKLLSSGALE